MEFSTVLLLICIPALVVAMFFVRRGRQVRGLGMFGAVCPRCVYPLPTVRKATSFWEGAELVGHSQCSSNYFIACNRGVRS
jgi:hypothetical protein